MSMMEGGTGVVYNELVKKTIILYTSYFEIR